MKDLFSQQAAEYAKYRPDYPQALYDFIFSQVKTFDNAWDCGTGNGQAAIALAKKFKHVMATDLSENQIQHAQQRSNITYQVCCAEKTPFPDHYFDLVTVAQALHWFDFDLFYPELKRVLKHEGIFAAWCYDLSRVNPKVDRVIDTFYNTILGPYWDKCRWLIDEKYQTIPFPLKKIDSPPFAIELAWDLTQYVNYISKTWSATQSYFKQHGFNPIDLILSDLENAWGESAQSRKITWPIYLLLGTNTIQ